MLRKAEKVLVMDDCTHLHEVDSPTTSTPDHGRKVSCTRMSFGDALSEVLTDTWSEVLLFFFFKSRSPCDLVKQFIFQESSCI